MDPTEFRIETKRELGPSEIEGVWGLLRTVSDADSHPPLGEHRWVDLVQGGRGAHAAITAAHSQDPQAPVGYAQISGSHGNWAIDLVVHPHHRNTEVTDAQLPPNSLAVMLLTEALAEVARAGGGHVHIWVPKPTAEDDATATAVGMSKGRDLLQLRRSLPMETELSRQARSLDTRPFSPGKDEAQWLAVNNRAFAWHPEQGEWTPDLLRTRLSEPWFDASGFLLHEREGTLAGFCWTKVHADHVPALGEIYVIAVDPRFQGNGIGRLLTLAGLEHLAREGLTVGMLYVDSANERALTLYHNLGFTLDHIDRAYTRDISASFS